MTISQFDLEFTKSGSVFDQEQEDHVRSSLADVGDLIVVSHGWNNDREEARTLYDDLTRSLGSVLNAGILPGLADRRIAMLRIFWPSKRFADEDLVPGGGAASAQPTNDVSLQRILEDLKRDPDRLGDRSIQPVRERHISRAQELVPRLDDDPSARRDYVLNLRAILNSSEREAEDGTGELFDRDPEELFDLLRGPITAPGATSAGGAAGLGTGGDIDFGDFQEGFRAAARRIANFATYYEMKERAGTVGKLGLGPLLKRLRDARPRLRIHLVGHSFGGRVVIAAANELPEHTESMSIALLQAAFSHHGLSVDYDGKGTAGSFRRILSERRVSGPIIITHTKNDKAVGIAYPIASRLAHDVASALGDQDDPYGGMGRNGAQHTPEVDETQSALEDVGKPYVLRPGRVYNLLADSFIADHGSVTGTQVAYAVLSAAASVPERHPE